MGTWLKVGVLCETLNLVTYPIKLTRWVLGGVFLTPH